MTDRVWHVKTDGGVFERRFLPWWRESAYLKQGNCCVTISLEKGFAAKFWRFIGVYESVGTRKLPSGGA